MGKVQPFVRALLLLQDFLCFCPFIKGRNDIGSATEKEKENNKYAFGG